MKKLGFGCMRFPLLDENDTKSIDKKQVCKMVDLFLERGFTYFDTAYMYHDYMSEKTVKECLVDRHPRSSFTIATKLPTMQLKKEEDNERIFNEQLSNLGVDYFDFYLLHCLNVANYKATNDFHSWDFVNKMKAEGKIKQLGFSFHDSAKLLDEILTAHPEVDFVQLQLNYLDWESKSVQSRLCHEVAVKHGKKIVVMEPVKGGKLANIPESAAKLLNDKDPNHSTASWAIRYAAGLENVFVVLSGMSNEQQMKDNLSYMEDFQPLNEEEQKVIVDVTKIINDSTAVPCTSCQYCIEGCPKQIPINDYFEYYNEEMLFHDGSGKRHYKAKVNEGYSKASECIACKQCEGHCPQHITIVKYLADIAEAFE